LVPFYELQVLAVRPHRYINTIWVIDTPMMSATQPTEALLFDLN
jgi:hypothetical protein